MDFEKDSMDEYERERLERRNRMKEEKRKQQARRQAIKKLIPFAVGALVLLIVLIGGTVKTVKVAKEKKAQKIEEQEAAKKEEEQRLLALTPAPTPTPEPPKVASMPEIKVQLPAMVEGYTMKYDGATSAVAEEDVQSQYALLLNATTGEAIVSKNGRDRINPASMTKVMTVLVAAEHVTDLDDKVTVLREDTDYAYKNDLSIAGFEADEEVTVRDLLYGAILPSGGECCAALERYVAGSDEAFVEMMNQKAAELGIADTTHFTNPAGVYNENHYSTLNDIAMIMKAAVENDLARQVIYEHVYTTSSTTQHPDGIEISNWFLRRIEDKYSKSEVLGAKTGYVIQSGNCAVSYTVVNGTTYICATGNAHSAWRAIFDHVYLYDTYAN